MPKVVFILCSLLFLVLLGLLGEFYGISAVLFFLAGAARSMGLFIFAWSVWIGVIVFAVATGQFT